MRAAATTTARAAGAPMDANQAVADVAYRLDEVIAIYPITPASPMSEWADVWSQARRPNLWGSVPLVVQMQSEAGAAGTLHGALQTGALATTFTSSQGLLLMLPDMFKIAGELSPAVIHVAARAVATHALSIFCDHSDVMTARTTGFAILASANPQEAHDLAAIAHAASLEGRLPFLHFFDGFRTSHEIRRVQLLTDDDLRAVVREAAVLEHRARALDPDRPVVRGTSQNPDVFFQSREASQPRYDALPLIVSTVMQRFAGVTGRAYDLCEYVGSPFAERVLVAMASATEAMQEAVESCAARGEPVGLVKVRLYRPFPAAALLRSLPETVRAIAVLDRTKEAGAAGEPLYLDVVEAVHSRMAEGQSRFGVPPRIVGGRYGLGSKEFTPAMAKAVLDDLAAPRPRQHFTVGITDDVCGSSLPIDTAFRTDIGAETLRSVLFGLGSDGTVGASKTTLDILGAHTGLHVQGFSVYDSKKSGALTVSHLRVSTRPIRSTYLIEPGAADLVACHHASLLRRHDVLRYAAPGGLLLLNAPWPHEEVWQHLPARVQRRIQAQGLRVHVIDAAGIAKAAGLAKRINTVMQVCWFALMNLLPRDQMLAAIEAAAIKAYGKRGARVVEQNQRAIQAALRGLQRVAVPTALACGPDIDARTEPQHLPAGAPPFVRRVTDVLLQGRGDELPVSALPADGTWPSATAQYEKRGLAEELPQWEPQLCIQCGKCSIVCPHAALRMTLADDAALAAAPPGFRAVPFKGAGHPGQSLIIQVAPDDCTGCELCVHVCPAIDAKAITPASGQESGQESAPASGQESAEEHRGRKALRMTPAGPRLERERAQLTFYGTLPPIDRSAVRVDTVRESQLLQPLFEFSGACAGCGETPYLKLLTQLWGDRMLVANATGCSSIFGGNLPTTPWSVDPQGRGPAWNNSLFEDAAEFGLGYRITLEQHRSAALQLLQQLAPRIAAAGGEARDHEDGQDSGGRCDGEDGESLVQALLQPPGKDEADVAARRRLIAQLGRRLAAIDTPAAHQLASLASALQHRSVWIVGGDGWAYDIGFGGLDHVLASGHEIKVLVLDTEVYSNTGGQMSKATPRAAVARFASGGKATPKKDLDRLAIGYGHVYVARIALGANDKQTVRALVEAERFDGPALILAYSHCIAHGFDVARGLEHQQLAVQSGHWPLYRYDPSRAARGENPLQLDSRRPTLPWREFAASESRFEGLTRADPAAAAQLMAMAQQDVDARWRWLEAAASAASAVSLHPDS